MSDLSGSDESVDPLEVRGTVKWFNAVKGFGFITPSEGTSDAFIHLSVLRDAGYEELQPGATVLCEVVQRAKGMQVMRLLEVDTSTATPVEQRSPEDDNPMFSVMTSPPGDFVDSLVKWFNTDKGYGFLTQDDFEQDIFIHMVTVRRSGMTGLQAGQIVQVRIAEGPKGPQATEIRASEPLD